MEASASAHIQRSPENKEKEEEEEEEVEEEAGGRRERVCDRCHRPLCGYHEGRVATRDGVSALTGLLCWPARSPFTPVSYSRVESTPRALSRVLARERKEKTRSLRGPGLSLIFCVMHKRRTMHHLWGYRHLFSLSELRNSLSSVQSVVFFLTMPVHRLAMKFCKKRKKIHRSCKEKFRNIGGRG